MSVAPSVILLEFNELTPSLMTRFIAEGHLPGFAQLYRESRVFTTDAEESGWDLEPWIQWVTVHTGVRAAEHGLRELGEAHKLRHKGLTEVLSAADRRVWICGSMNARYGDRLDGAFLPDPWSRDVEPHPADLQPYHAFVRKVVLEHTRAAPVSLADCVAFCKFMVGHGLSPSTALAIVTQLARERGGHQRWKRVAVLDRLQWDVFRWYYRRIRPHFSTFFLNSTAHLQHKYWRNAEPEPFTVKPTPEDQAEFEKAILFGYQQMDVLVRRLLQLAGTDTTLVFCTALSQQPCLLYEETGGKCFYRPHDIGHLLAFAGVTTQPRCFPVMSEQFHLQFEDDREATSAEARLNALHVSGQKAMYVRREGSALFAGCMLIHQVSAGAMLQAADTGTSAPFNRLFYKSDGVKSGMHHPDGMLWIRLADRRHTIVPGKVSLLSIAPTILHLLGVAPSHAMNAGSLLDVPAAA